MTEQRAVPLQPLPQWQEPANAILNAHLGNTDLLLSADTSWTSVDAPPVFVDNRAAWEAIFREQVTPGMEMVLDRFELTNWFPRAPGLFFTQDAESARAEAYQYLHHGFGQPPIRDHAGDRRPDADYTVVFTPEGKLSMLQGGIGAIRLKPIRIQNEPHWLMTATSDGVAHTGVPLAIPLSKYRRVWSLVTQRGAFTVTARGWLEFAPSNFSRLYDASVMLPKLYLRVTDLEPAETRVETHAVSAAISFVSEFEGAPRVYVSYVTFEPDVEGSFDEAMHWLKHEYVEGAYRGRIITDFDQTRTVFPEASLALTRVMERQVDGDSLRESIELMHASADFERYFDELKKANLLPQRPPTRRKKVFVSYAHAAEERTGWVGRIRTHLKGLLYEEDIDYWDDTRIEAGEDWRREIEQAIENTRVAILVLTADFLASKFVREVELPMLLEAADADGAKILTVFGSDVHPSRQVRELSRYQYVNKPDMPLHEMSESGRESVFRALTGAVEQELSD